MIKSTCFVLISRTSIYSHLNANLAFMIMLPLNDARMSTFRSAFKFSTRIDAVPFWQGEFLSSYMLFPTLNQCLLLSKMLLLRRSQTLEAEESRTIFNIPWTRTAMKMICELKNIMTTL